MNGVDREEQSRDECERQRRELGKHQHHKRGDNSMEQHVHQVEHRGILAPDRPLDAVKRRRRRSPQSQIPAILVRPIGRNQRLRESAEILKRRVLDNDWVVVVSEVVEHAVRRQKHRRRTRKERGRADRAQGRIPRPHRCRPGADASPPEFTASCLARTSAR